MAYNTYTVPFGKNARVRITPAAGSYISQITLNGEDRSFEIQDPATDSMDYIIYSADFDQTLKVVFAINNTTTTTAAPTTAAPITTTTTAAPVGRCLSATNAVTFASIDGVNSYVFGGTHDSYKANIGTYVLSSVSPYHPIAILNYGKTSAISYAGTSSAGTKLAPDDNTYEYFYGDVTITVSSDFGTVSYACYNHGYMGGENNLSLMRVAN